MVTPRKTRKRARDLGTWQCLSNDGRWRFSWLFEYFKEGTTHTQLFTAIHSVYKKMQNNEKENFTARRLKIRDNKKGFIELLQQLSICDSISENEFEDRFREIDSLGDDHVICVIEDEISGKIIATGSVFIEKKFLRNCGKVGHIEDVVVDSSVRGKQLGKKVIDFLTHHARSIGCYKVILDCSIENRVFYEKCGFKQKEIQMAMYFV
ncbi:Glucosamine-phosphate N-acetyltransferase-like protein [Trifolium repens]|nr:Glucosamine-phosphate N-acetyltransferase-like protein [Trifolium repens]